jgi:glycosyltransferase involved in cell wall biosynthesis
MARKPTLYFDVTQLAHWTGRVTGIPRVMDELARRFYDEPGAAVRFVVWVKDAGEFCEIDFARTVLAREGIVYLREGEEEVVDGGESASSEAAAPPPFSQLVKRGAVKIAKKGLRIAAKVHGGVAARLEARAKQAYSAGYKRAEFHSGDLFFIPWGEWWDPNFTDRLVRAHEEQGVRLVQVIHDIATTVWPQFFEKVEVNPASYNAKVVPAADLVITVSKNTKKELTTWLQSQKLPVPKTEVIRLGDNPYAAEAKKPEDPVFTAAKLKGQDYLLCVGTIEAKKNHALFYYVYKLARERGIDLPKLVIVGRRGYGTDDIYRTMTQDPEISDQFIFLHNTGDEELSWLYDHCLFTVLPSFHEGWGIPIAESVARGVPCLSSGTSSMVEIAEGMVGHFSPASSDECLAAIQQWLKPKELEAARKRTKAYKATSWNDTFNQVNTFLKEL